MRVQIIAGSTKIVRSIMDDEEYWDILTVDEIAGEFQIPLLAEIIEKNKKIDVNMNHISGWYEEDGEKYHFMPDVQFHPMEDGNGFKILIFDALTEKEGTQVAEVTSFYKSDEEPGNYKVFLDEECHLLSEEVTLPDFDPDNDEELETYPASDVPGYENPFKNLDHNPTLEI